ncbi:MAG: ATP-dependent DNA helicase DinG [Gammaproteobacteria bacterium]|nr:ATP-dependent DNA helicase DinG [Gammaproteobacteria bacterium]
MLTDKIKEHIQSIYRQLLTSRKLIARYGQRQMIAEIANKLSILENKEDSLAPICLIEAGTGTGKTLAYLLGVLPLAQKLGYKVVISTATIALQEQVVLKDIPEIIEGSDFEFKFALAKGRGRYLCLSKLNMLLEGSDSLQAIMDLDGEEVVTLDGKDMSLYESMLSELNLGSWKGDRDNWKDPVANDKWQPLTVDHRQCTSSSCSYFRTCCFYQARESLDKVDCIVSNHDLVLTDLSMGGGAILPEPEKCIYIFDEAHHLPIKSNNHFSSFAKIRGITTWLEHCKNLIIHLIERKLISEVKKDKVEILIQALSEESDNAWYLLEELVESLISPEKYENEIRYTFSSGVIPEQIRRLSVDFVSKYAALISDFEEIDSDLRQIIDEGSNLELISLAEKWCPAVGATLDRAEASLTLWLSYANKDAEGAVPMARWVSAKDDGGIVEIILCSSPVLAASNLQENLWEKCAGAVLTSATLSALGKFDMIKLKAGLPDQTSYLRILSPFDFASSGKFVVPKMNCDPSDAEKHTSLLISSIPKLLTEKSAALMLFSSRRQMLDVMQNLPRAWADMVLCQDDYQKTQLLKYHRHRIDNGEGSIIFGLASFSEGIDLPGKYCEDVLIAKIPFIPPNDPVEMTLAAWIEQQGENPFIKLAIPEAAMKLVQASGRLLRSENDTGRIILFDERIVHRRYGKTILESMPPYRLEIFLEDLSG